MTFASTMMTAVFSFLRCIKRLAASVAWTLVWSGLFTSAVLADDRIGSDSADFALVDFWAQQNRKVTIYWLSRTSKYYEVDPFGRTPDGFLDTETINCCHGAFGVGAFLNWQGVQRGLPLWVRVQLDSTKGQSDYSGYLQRGIGLEPYASKTQNHWNSAAVRLGIPFAVDGSLGIPIRAQVIPTIQWERHSWRRGLTQYTEYYQATSYFFGAIAQLSLISSNTSALLLHVSWHGGWRGSNAVVEVPALTFSGGQNIRKSIAIEIGSAYQINPKWSLEMNLQENRQALAASNTVEALQAPASKSTAIQVRVGISLRY